MPASDWKTVKEILFAALELDPEQRQKFLANAKISPEMRAEVESLLLNEANVDSFMTVTASGFTRELVSDLAGSEAVHTPQRFGVYETVAEIGFGGMGVVYLAKRVDGKFEQTVAIKILKREFNTARIREIFRREKEILATLSHPNIASLLDAGTTDDGIPYLVMEYVDGQPIDEFCDTLKLSLESRLKLFNKVCDTVARAHRSLIVHRDLKPSNILVTNEGEPKLLDFGISKLLDVDKQDIGTVTQFYAMTPQYASPEQLNGASVTTATDVYSLGVVLFKILTGNLPRSLGKSDNGKPNSLSPTLPSEATKRSDAASPISSAVLKGDLDNIVLKALRVEPDRRYSSVEQFSSDIWRFIDGMPVLARSATLSYRASKFFGRHKVPVVAATLVLLSLVVGIAIAVSQAKAARQQSRIAHEQRDAAQRATERAQKTSKFMQGFLDYATPNWYGRGRGRKNVTVREAIDDAAGRIDSELADQVEVRADLHYTIAVVYASHTEPDKFLEHAKKSLELYRQAFGENHPRVARGLYYYSIASKGKGAALEEAVATLEHGVTVMRQTGPNDVNLPYMLQTLGDWITSNDYKLRTKEHFDRAENLNKEAKALFIQHYGETHGSTLSADITLAIVVLRSGDLDRAETLWIENLRRLKPRDYHMAWSLGYLGAVKSFQNKKQEAEALFAESMDLARQSWGEKDERFIALAEQIKQFRAGKCC